MVDRQVGVGQRLRFHPLRSVHHEERAFAGCHAAGDLIGKIDMSRRIDQIQDIILAVRRLVPETNGVGLDGNAPLPLEVHVVQDLVGACCGHFPVGKRSRVFENPVGECRFAVIDMGNNAEVSDIRACHTVLRYHNSKSPNHR